jgi:uncharacterized protein YfaS (alpha-2-macroglobulin family)
MKTTAVLGVLSAFALTAIWLTAAQQTPQSRRERLTQQYTAGNFKDAYDGFRKFALDPKVEREIVGNDLSTAVICLQRLGRSNEIDELLEAVIAVHKDNWRLLESAAHLYASHVEHFGFMIAGKFQRGSHRGGGRMVGSMQRDRTRALQLMQQALDQTRQETRKVALARFHLSFANLLLNGGGEHAPWRLQYLTNLAELPDYEDGVYYPRFRGGFGGGFGLNQRGAPVDADGNPILYHVPKSYADAQSDGERWRWMLVQAAEFNPALANEADMLFGNFLYSQFGVETMAQYGRPFRGAEDRDRNKSGTYALHTLSDKETIARLATGIKRFELPDEFNYIKVFERVAGRGKNKFGEQARDMLARVYENRRQYVKAAAAWQKAIAEYGTGHNNYRRDALDQIVGNWGRFEPGHVQPAGKPAVVDFRYRNGKKAAFEAFEINVPKLLADVKAYLKNHQGQLDYQRFNIADIGYRLVQRQENQYLGAKVAAFNMDLNPRPEHVDALTTITTPLQKPGAYLLTAKMADGNTSRVIVWLSDTMILKKQLDGQAYYFVADAVTGRPVPKADVEFFGWRQVQVAPNRNQWRVESTSFRQATDKDGQIFLDQKNVSPNLQWLAVARKDKRFAYLGFTGMWFGRIYDPQYNATKVFGITDRPVYRPDQTVQFKFWVRHTKYDQPDTSDFAGKPFTVQIQNPKGEKIYEQAMIADAYGGLAGEFYLSKGTTLGVYHIHVLHHGGTNFRVEEYKKPEFEVLVEAPKEPVRLGEQITATIKANYYFGAPVTKARVKYKVLRTAHNANWYPMGRWDWFYGPGYWWFSPEFAWFPGWHNWGICRPVPWWIGARNDPPEVVLENEVEIGPDGTVPVLIDTRPAKELHGDQDHQFAITAEVVDESRRTIVGTGNVLVSRKPFRVYAWVNRGHFRTGDTVKARFNAQTLDHKPVQGKGELTLYRISYDKKNQPVETAVETWKLDTDAQGQAEQQMKAATAGQYRLSYKVTDAKQNAIEGGYLFVVRGAGFTGSDYRFNDIEIVTDKREYNPGENVKLMVNTNQDNGTVLLFVRPNNGVYLPPRMLRLKGKSTVEEVGVVQRDMPNFFIEAVTVSNGAVHSETREVIVPPEKRVLNVEVLPSQKEYLPGQKATVKLKLTDTEGRPFIGSTVVSVYDKSVEYIAGGSNVPEIKQFFWKWRRSHHSQTESSLARSFGNILRQNERGMGNLGIFGEMVIDEMAGQGRGGNAFRRMAADGPVASFGAAKGLPGGFGGGGPGGALPAMAPANANLAEGMDRERFRQESGTPTSAPPSGIEPTVRQNFADTAFWKASLATDQNGIAEVTFTMPENLTAWKVRVWAMGHGTKVGQGDAEVVTKKDLLVRLQAPRFFVQKDEVVLSANVHNYLKADKKVNVSLELEGKTLEAMTGLAQQVSIPAGGEKRIDWRVKVTNEGEATVRVKAIGDTDSDAMQMRFPCYIHGMSKMESFTGVIRPDKYVGAVTFNVPKERRVNDTRLEVRYSPTLAGAMVDALPYLVDYPYGCTEQTLNRFLPTVITQRLLQRMNLDLKAIEKHRTNLNSQEIGDDKQRIAKGWKRFDRNPVFNIEEVKDMAKSGVQALANMQLSDGGWGWFSGFGERSFPHTTAVVVHGLQLAKFNNVELPAGMLERGLEWLKGYQARQIQLLQNFATKTEPYREFADNLDALVYMVLVDGGINSDTMRDFLYRDRTHLAVYAKAMYGLTLHRQQQADKLAMILRNIEQYLVQDDENQTAYLRLPADNHWWYWYGSETEANAYYLKLLSRTSPKDEKASRLVKYLLNNRRHATYWNSTRDTAVCIEAMAEYLVASGEDRPDMTVEVWLDGKKQKEVKINAENLFTFDNKMVLLGDAVETGKHTLELKRQGTGPVYFNAYVTNFTLEDFITKAGLEVRVNRKYYKLTRDDKAIKVSGARGQAADQRVERYKRTELPNLATLKSGDLVEIELEIDSKNDYEYLIFEDMKAAGFEPLLVRSGYTANGLGAYMELRDEKVCFFVRALARGKHSISYRMRAEVPGQFSALPTRAYAMYAPELRGNSDEIKLRITD